MQAIWPVLGICLVAYFTYHAIQGPRGILVYRHLRGEVNNAEILLASLEAERTHIEGRVNKLRPESLSADMLEERARELLNYSHPNDLIILLPDKG